MNYGWSCKKCGFSVSSDDKVEVKNSKRGHKWFGCLLEQVFPREEDVMARFNLLSRPSLLDIARDNNKDWLLNPN